MILALYIIGSCLVAGMFGLWFSNAARRYRWDQPPQEDEWLKALARVCKR